MTTTSEARQLLERRAGKLAQRPSDERVVATVDVVTFSVSGRRCALEARHVSRILRAVDLCRLPDEGGELVGLTMVGGLAVPVADLGSLLLLSPADRTRSFVVLLGGAGVPLGLLVDEVESFGQVTEKTLTGLIGAALYDAGAGQAAPLEQGVTADGVVLLDGDALLAHPRAVAVRTRRTRPDHAPHVAPAPPSTQENPCED